jgi:metal-responsive CopG/Arc/MetJ family transcriptional regulator
MPGKTGVQYSNIDWEVMRMEEKPAFIGLKCPGDLVQQLDRLARRRFISRSDCIRSLLRAQLEREREQRVDEAAA